MLKMLVLATALLLTSVVWAEEKPLEGKVNRSDEAITIPVTNAANYPKNIVVPNKFIGTSISSGELYELVAYAVSEAQGKRNFTLNKVRVYYLPNGEDNLTENYETIMCDLRHPKNNCRTKDHEALDSVEQIKNVNVRYNYSGKIAAGFWDMVQSGAGWASVLLPFWAANY